MINSRVLAGVFVALYPLGWHNGAMAETGSYGVFRSQDRGQTWSRSDTGLPRRARINAFSKLPNAVLAGTDDGVYISRDRGLTWKRALGTASGEGRILSFATMGERVYAGTGGNRLAVSLDGGINWALNTTPFRKVRTLLTHEGALYAGSDAEGVFVSQDGGHSWTSIGQGLPRSAQIFSLASLNGKIFAGLYSKGLYVWERRRRSWRKAGSVSPLVLATTGDTLLAGHNPGGIFRSDDLGQTWTAGEITFSEDPDTAPVWELGAGPDLAVAGVSSRIYRSNDQGRTWREARVGLPDGSSGIAFLVDRGFVLAGVLVRSDPLSRPNE